MSDRDDDRGRLPPTNTDAEASTLASLVLDNAQIEPVQAILQKSDFYDPGHKEVFDAITTLHKKGVPVDLVTLTDCLKTRHRLRAVGGADELVKLLEVVPSAANAIHYANIVWHCSIRRSLIDSAEKIIGDAQNPSIELDDVLRGRPASMSALVETLGGGRNGKARFAATTTLASTVEPRAVNWLWEGWIACGTLSILGGRPSKGKTWLACDLAARVSSGLPWPDGTYGGDPGSVVFVSGEDDAQYTLVPRFISAGANLEKIILLDGITENRNDGDDREKVLNISLHIEAVEKVITDAGDVKLLILDPLSSFMPNVNSWQDSDVRSSLAPLAQIAERHGVAILLVRHLNKRSGDADAMGRLSGSIGFVAAARTAMLLETDPEQEDWRIVASIKNNLGPPPDSLAFRIDPDGDGSGPSIYWSPDAVAYSADDLLVPRDYTDPETQEITEWLKVRLALGAVEVPTLKDEAKAAGYSWSHVKKAGRILNLVHGKAAFGGKGTWELKPFATGK